MNIAKSQCLVPLVEYKNEILIIIWKCCRAHGLRMSWQVSIIYYATSFLVSYTNASFKAFGLVAYCSYTYDKINGKF